MPGLNFRAKPKRLFIKLSRFETALLNAARRKLQKQGRAVKEDDLVRALLRDSLSKVCHEEIEQYKSSLTTTPEDL